MANGDAQRLQVITVLKARYFPIILQPGDLTEGVNTKEQGGNATYDPLYAVLGIDTSPAIPVAYSTVISIEARSY